MQAANIVIMAQVVHIHQDSDGSLAIPLNIDDIFRRPAKQADAPAGGNGAAPVAAAADTAAASAAVKADAVVVQDGVITLGDLPTIDETVIWEGNSIRGTFTVLDVTASRTGNGTDRVIKMRPLSGYQKKDLRGQWADAETHKKVVYLNVADVQSGHLRYAA